MYMENLLPRSVMIWRTAVLVWNGKNLIQPGMTKVILFGDGIQSNRILRKFIFSLVRLKNGFFQYINVEQFFAHFGFFVLKKSEIVVCDCLSG